jgi:hypothetical protein
MSTMEARIETIDHDTLLRLVDAGTAVRADVVGHAGGWGVVINHGQGHQTLAARRGHPRLFRRFETLTGYLKDIGITAFHVDAAAFDAGAGGADPSDRRSIAASERMKHAHAAAAYDKWFRRSVQDSIDDPRPNVPDEQARSEFANRREGLRSRSKASTR